ncbi:MAG: hypothetical protein ACREPX_06310 [Rhodanobacteraceae bacterium]
MVRRIAICALFLMLFAQQASAFFDPPWITPTQPRAGETVAVNIHGGICDAIFERPGYPQIAYSGDAIRVVEFGDHATFEDFCIYGVGTLTLPIGTFPPGNFTLTVDLAYQDFFGEPQILNIGVVPFTVVGISPAAPVPTISRTFILALLFLLLGLSTWALSRSPPTQGRAD